ncbi:MAG TPA: hypothetical protein VEN81_11430, partial [Planctomycetota bacterium]|nr:hypothetical protein [Planctomycetota bacterium]
MTRDELDLALVRYLDRSAGPEEVELLGQALREDPEARALLRAIALQALTLSDLAGSQELEKRAPLPASRPGLRPRAKVPLAVAAAALLALGAGLAWWASGRPAEITLSRVRGSASWRPEGGLPRTGLESNAALAGPGTLTVEGAGNFAEVRFEDGTTVGLSGDSELSILAGLQKRLVLSRGSVVVDARPQPPARPILVRT